MLFLLLLVAAGTLRSADSGPAQAPGAEAAETPVRASHLQEIKRLFAAYGLAQADVSLDRSGRVVLKGGYQDREEVEVAHSIAQSVVGVNWTSVVAPENVRVANLQKRSPQTLEARLDEGNGSASPRTQAGPPAPPPAAVKPSSLLELPPGPIKRRYALVMGVGKFSEMRIDRLQYPSSDAQSVYDFLRDSAGGKFRVGDEIELLLDRRAVSSSVLAWLDRVERLAEPDDLVILYASTHGSTPDSQGMMALATFDTVVDPPTRAQLRKTSVTGARLAQFIQNVRAKRLVLIIDACYNAAAFKDIPGYQPRDSAALAVDNEVYGITRDSVARLMGGKASVREDDVAPGSTSMAPGPASRDGWGRVLITASGPDQLSWESPKLQAGFFTHFFVRGLRSTGNVRNAFAYTREVVPKEVMSEKKSVQIPQAYSTSASWGIGF